MARCVASLLLLVALVAAACSLTVQAFAPGAAVNRRGGKLATAFSRVWGAKQQRQLALSRLMATRGGVAGGKVQEVRSLAETEEALEAAGEKLVVMDFTATWCGPCKLIAPIFESLSEEVSDAVFLKVDVDENEETARKFDVMQMPTFLFVKNGEIQGRLVGANPDKLREAVHHYL